MAAGRFSTVSIETTSALLVPLEPSQCAPLAEAIAAMPPWSVMGYSAALLASFLAAEDENARRYLVEVRGEPAGAMAIRSPWLRGPYLELLALLPRFQGKGLGSRLLAWLEGDAAAGGARNLWVCASSFNECALRFYQRHGFEPVARLPGLVADDHDEILLRKFPLTRA